MKKPRAKPIAPQQKIKASPPLYDPRPSLAIYCIGDIQGLRRRSGAPAGHHRLFCQPGHGVPARGPRQPRPRLRRSVAPLHCSRGCHPLPAGQPRPALLAAAHGARANRRARYLGPRCSTPRTAALCSNGCVISPWRGPTSIPGTPADGARRAWSCLEHEQTLALAAQEVQDVLRNPDFAAFLHAMYGNARSLG